LKTRLLGAAVLIALAVIFVPMFFTGSPPTPGGDQSVSLAIPPAPDRDLQTKTMSLDPSAAASAAGALASGDRIATVTIDSNRPRDVELDPEAGRTPAPTTVTTGSGTSPAQPVIPQRDTAATTPTAPAATKPAPASESTHPAAKPAAPAPAPAVASAAHGSYTINLSAYASASGAAKLQSRVRALGYPVSGRAITRAGQSRTLVTAGPFETRTAAEAARLKITQAIPGVPAKVEQDADVSGTSTPATSTATHTARAGGWAVQLAAVSSQTDANALRDKLRAAGFDGFVDSVRSGGRTLWRVRAGPQTQRTDAQRVHDQIKAKLGIDGNVVSVP
jgi:cell division septation protein DedD